MASFLLQLVFTALALIVVAVIHPNLLPTAIGFAVFFVVVAVLQATKLW